MSDWPDCMILSHAQTGVGLSCRGYGLLLKRLAEAEESNKRLQQTGLEALTTLAAQDEILRKSRLRLAEAEAEIARADYATRRAVERLAKAEALLRDICDCPNLNNCATCRKKLRRFLTPPPEVKS